MTANSLRNPSWGYSSDHRSNALAALRQDIVRRVDLAIVHPSGSSERRWWLASARGAADTYRAIRSLKLSLIGGGL